jgi:hypothetical protein
VTRRQLRPFYTTQERAEIYRNRYNHGAWNDHVLRVSHLAEILREMQPSSVADLSCGDGAVLLGAELSCALFFGDITPGWQFTGPMEETLFRCPPVDVFVLSEILEHLEDPEGTLAAVRGRARRLLLSTPDGELNDANPEHYWTWQREDLRPMLADAGWTPDSEPELYTPSFPAYYAFQIWTCS